MDDENVFVEHAVEQSTKAKDIITVKGDFMTNTVHLKEPMDS